MATSEIYTYDDLVAFRNIVNGGTTNQDANLHADITIPGEIFWTKIGTIATKYAGTFNGNDHNISGVNIPAIIGGDGTGFFGYVNGGTISNVRLPNCSIASFDDFIGGLAGCIEGATNITNCSVDGHVNGADYIGGLVGYTLTGSTISNCYTDVVVVGTVNYAGGLLGSNNSGTISDCYSAGPVTGDYGCGGFVGRNRSSGTILDCHSVGSVSSSHAARGGLCGINDGDSAVTTSYYNSTTSGQSDTGKGVPLTSAEYLAQNNFVGFDFNDTWYMGDTMPLLQYFRSIGGYRSRYRGSYRGRYTGQGRY